MYVRVQVTEKERERARVQVTEKEMEMDKPFSLEHSVPIDTG